MKERHEEMKSRLFSIVAGTGVVVFSLVATSNVYGFGYGYGAVATGGTTAFKVTNLNDSGTGSLRDALSAGGRLITFNVSGTIEISSVLIIPSNTTLDGTGKSITIHGHYVSISNKKNIIIKNIRFREDSTAPADKCSLQGSACGNIMVDHCSIEWATYDCCEFTSNSSNITVQYCIIGASIASQYSGGLIDSANKVSIHHNLWIDNKTRNPKLKGNCQYINNVVYNWCDTGGLIGGHSSANWYCDIINNYFIKGPTSANDNWLTDCGTTDCWYVSGNYKDLDKNGSLNGTAIAASEFTAKSVTVLSTKQHNPSTAVPVHTAAAAVSQAASGAWGCQPLDSYDTTLVSYLKSYGTQGKKGK
jgi:pectate lyase